MLNAARGTPQQHLLEQLGIRTMAKAIYTSENIGHYGLGFEHYCHFTSPIRRYPDIIVHRVLQQVLDGKIVPDKKMEEKCKHSSERERAAMECERASNKYKQVEYMSQFLGEEFDAVVTGVSSFGFWAETVAHKCEGLVGMKDLNYYDDFRLVEADYTLVGLRSGRKFRIGDLVKIKVVAASLERRQLDYEWIMKPQSESAISTITENNASLSNTPDRLSGIPLEAAVIKAKIEAARDRKSDVRKGKATNGSDSSFTNKKIAKKKEKKIIPDSAPIPKAIKKKMSGK
jgi:ribonuclease R